MDHSIFNLLPKGTWKRGNAFRYCPWKERPDPAHPMGWVTGPQLGNIEPMDDAVWSLNPGIPRDARLDQCVHFSDGVSIQYEHQGKAQSLELYAIYPNGLAGISSLSEPPILDSIQELPQSGDGFTTLSRGEEQVFLSWKPREDGCQFLLVKKPHHEHFDASTLSARLDFDLREDLIHRYSKRRHFCEMCADAELNPAELHPAFEKVLYALRAPTPPFSHLWVESSNATCHVNEIHSHILAWLHIAPEIAVDLLRSAASLSTMDGRIPAVVLEGTEQPVSSTAWPLLNQTALIAAKQLDDASALKDLLPRLHTSLLRTLHYLETPQHDIHSWTSPQEALLPDNMDKDLATVDCSALLLAEIEAYLALINLLGLTGTVETQALTRRADQLRNNLSTFFYDQKSQSYRDHYIHGEPVSRITFSAVTPLFTSHPDAATTNTLHQFLLGSKFLKAPGGIRAWQEWNRDDEKPPVENIHQSLLTLLCEKQLDRWYLPLVRTWTETYRNHGTEPDANPGFTAAWFLRLSFLRTCAEQDQRSFLLRRSLKKKRLAIIGLPFAAAIFLVLGIIIFFMAKRTPPKNTAETLIGFAAQCYQVEKYPESIDVLTDLYNSNVRQPAILNLLAKSYYKTGKYEKAETYFRSLLGHHGQPAARFNLALTLYRIGNIEEATSLYGQIVEEDSGTAPSIANRAQLCLNLMDINTPPQPLEREPYIGSESAADGEKIRTSSAISLSKPAPLGLLHEEPGDL